MMKKLMKNGLLVITAAMICGGLYLQKANYINGSAIFATGMVLLLVIVFGESYRDNKSKY